MKTTCVKPGEMSEPPINKRGHTTPRTIAWNPCSRPLSPPQKKAINPDTGSKT